MNQTFSGFTKSTMLLFFLALAASCNFTGKLTRRYHSVSYSPQGCKIGNFVSVHASVPEKDATVAPGGKGLLELGPYGQSALIQELSKKEASSADFFARLRTELGIPPDKGLPEILDYTRFNKRILSAVRKLPIQEGERIEKVVIRITVNDPNFVFRHFNRIVTEYMNVDLGKITYSNTNAFELAGNMGTGVELGTTGGTLDKVTSSNKIEDETLGSDRTTNNGITNKATAASGLTSKFNASRSMNEEVQLRQRLVALNAFVDANRLFLYQEGISGIDLTGNILTDVVGEYLNNIRIEKVRTIDNLYTAAAPTAQGGIEIKENYLQSPNITTDITATVQFEAVYRKIDVGDRTITESDDRITVIYGSTMEDSCSAGTRFVLIPANTLRPNTWKITYQPSGGGPRLPLHIVDGIDAGSALLFINYGNATEFLRWLKGGVAAGRINLSTSLGAKGHKLFLGDNKTVPNAAEVNSLQIELN